MTQSVPRHSSHFIGAFCLRAKLTFHCSQSCDPVLLSKAFCIFVRPILEYSQVRTPQSFGILGPDYQKFLSQT